nr:MAG TPA: hypothetical protein [Caudoviricetes sp.]DAX07614.1 MAG TPA: hypothetical protein [Bacteriophage sp.]
MVRVKVTSNQTCIGFGICRGKKPRVAPKRSDLSP